MNSNLLDLYLEFSFSKKQLDFLYLMYTILSIYSKNCQIYFKDFLMKSFFYMKDFFFFFKIYDLEAYDIINLDNIDMLILEAIYTIKYYNINHFKFKKSLSINNYFSEKELYNIEKNIF